MLALQTQYILTGVTVWDPLTGFVFCSTWLLYALHRIVGILRLKDFLNVERYGVIARFRHHIIIYAIIAGIGTTWYFFQMPFRVQIATVLPSFFSLAYVLPFFGKRRRLRDFNQIKIYLVALVWAWVTVVLPVVQAEIDFNTSHVLMYFERALFVFAITLPFDIRDLKVDRHSDVSTIPAKIGVKKTNHLALVLLSIALILVLINIYLGFYSTAIGLALLVSLITTGFLVRISTPERHDYFYSGLMDGTMVLQGGLVCLTACYLLS